jgi:hypothetical protein
MNITATKTPAIEFAVSQVVRCADDARGLATRLRYTTDLDTASPERLRDVADAQTVAQKSCVAVADMLRATGDRHGMAEEWDRIAQHFALERLAVALD